MVSLVEKKLGGLAIDGESTYKPVPFGKEMLSSFLFAPEFKNMNHGRLFIGLRVCVVDFRQAPLVLSLVQFKRSNARSKTSVNPGQILSSVTSILSVLMNRGKLLASC